MCKKCNKYESIFVFRDDEEFLHHINTCKDCKEKYDEMLQIEELLKTAKPYYNQRKKQNRFLDFKQAVACFAIIVITSFVSGNLTELDAIVNNIQHPEVSQYVNNSIFNQMRLPTDEYGLLDPHKEFFND